MTSGSKEVPHDTKINTRDQITAMVHASAKPAATSTITGEQSTALMVALMTGGRDKPYVLGLAAGLTAAGVSLDLIGSNELDVAELRSLPKLRFLNLRGEQSPQVNLGIKLVRLITYYSRLAYYAAIAKPKIFHILWNNKFEVFDRTLLMLYYKLLRKKIVLTAHNVNAGQRDSQDTYINRLTLRVQYALTDHIFVHTELMKSELVAEFNAPVAKITVIPYGIDNTAPTTELRRGAARQRLNLHDEHRVILFYGLITPYKGLEYLVEAFVALSRQDPKYRLIIAGKPKWNNRYWNTIERQIAARGIGAQVMQKIDHVPDNEIELYFKAADVIVLPYTFIFQSGVLFLAYGFGLPVIATDVGSFRNYVVEGKTGFIAQPKNSTDLAATIHRYFASDLYRDQVHTREQIREYANKEYSWSNAAGIIRQTYRHLVGDSTLDAYRPA